MSNPVASQRFNWKKVSEAGRLEAFAWDQKVALFPCESRTAGQEQALHSRPGKRRRARSTGISYPPSTCLAGGELRLSCLFALKGISPRSLRQTFLTSGCSPL